LILNTWETGGDWLPWDDKDLGQEHKGQFGVSKRQSPETQVGSSIGYSTEHELNSLNHLMDHQLTETVLMIIVTFFGKNVSNNSGIVNSVGKLTRSVKSFLFWVLNQSLFVFIELVLDRNVFINLKAGGVSNRLNTEHERHADNSADNHDSGSLILMVEPVRTGVHTGRKLQEVVNHDSDNRRAQVDFILHV